MIERLATAGVYVRDQQAALEFWRDKMGFEVRTDMAMGPDARWIAVAPPGSQAEVILMAPSWAEDLEREIGGFTRIGFCCKDLGATWRELAEKGVVFTRSPASQDWGGDYAEFADPDGNRFALFL